MLIHAGAFYHWTVGQFYYFYKEEISLCRPEEYESTS